MNSSFLRTGLRHPTSAANLIIHSKGLCPLNPGVYLSKGALKKSNAIDTAPLESGMPLGSLLSVALSRIPAK
ncbi:hypothetical protein HMPREF1986_00123 [Oribacterium sp. oral taxon 078 str. F0263]|nr:hypothetical protein HMPREF1986_00123 [Oribacterium sp. oral taxon 078 str. F0263]